MLKTDNCPCNDLLINGEPLASCGGTSLLDYTIGQVPLTMDTWQGKNRTNWNLLNAEYGIREIRLTIRFAGETLHAAKLLRSRFNSHLFGEFELFVPGDGFFYHCWPDSLGDEVLVGIGRREAQIKSEYKFKGVRHDTLVRVDVPANGKLFCESTLPKTDCRVTATVQAGGGGSATESATGTTINISTQTSAEMQKFLVTLPPNAAGYTQVRVTDGHTPSPTTTTFSLPSRIYGGTAELISGAITETSQRLASYDPLNVPAPLASLIEAYTQTATESISWELIEDSTGQLDIPGGFGDYALQDLTIRFAPRQTGVPSPDSPQPIHGASGMTVTVTKYGDGTTKQTQTVTFPSVIYGGEYDPLTGTITSEWGEIASYNGETLPGDWLSTMDLKLPWGSSTPTIGAKVVYKLQTPVTVQVTPVPYYSYSNGSTVTAECVPSESGYLVAAWISGISADYQTGELDNIPGVATASGVLTTGAAVAYPRSAPVQYAGTPTPIPIPTGTCAFRTVSTNYLINAEWTTLDAGYTIMGALFENVSIGDVLAFDGIVGGVFRNGQSWAAQTQWVHFPSLTPGENTIQADGPVTVEYYPSYF
jgi:hypothetical protein